MTHFKVIDVPCKFCSAQPKEHCHTRMGRKYYPLHVKRKELAGYVNDGTFTRLLKKHR
jgi:hypothetical protein